MIIDYYSWNPDPLGDETLPAECWPDPKAMVDELKQMGVELMISPYFHEVTSQSKHYQKALDNGYLVQDADGKPATGAYVTTTCSTWRCVKMCILQYQPYKIQLILC